MLEVCGLHLVIESLRSPGSIELCFLSWELLRTFRETMLAGIAREMRMNRVGTVRVKRFAMDASGGIAVVE